MKPFKMNKAVGPIAWAYLHIAAAHLEDPQAFRVLLCAVARTYPCPLCRKHAGEYLATHDLSVIVDSVSASRYMLLFHNSVNSLTKGTPFTEEQYRYKWGINISHPLAKSRR